MSGSQPRRRPRPATVAYYFDADVLGLARIVASIREDATFPGDPGAIIRKKARPACPISDPKTPDLVWIPAVAARGWSIITRDRRITSRPAEIQAIRDHGAKVFVLAASEPLSKWGQLEILLCRWREIERISALPGPYAYALTRTARTKLDLGTSPTTP